MVFSVIVLLVFLATFLSNPQFSAGWAWDLLQGLGYCAAAIWLYLIIDTGKSGTRAHQHLSIIAVVLAATHGVALLAWDKTLWQYLTPDAHIYMLAGPIALALMVVGLMFALPRWRRNWHPGYGHFQRWHRWLAWVGLIATSWHIAASGAYLDQPGVIALALLLVVLTGLRLRPGTVGPGRSSLTFHPGYLVVLPLSLLVFVLVRQF